MSGIVVGDGGFGADAGPEELRDSPRKAFAQQSVVAAVESLPPQWRASLWHVDVLGREPVSVAMLLNIEPDAVDALLLQARGGLRKVYEQQTQRDVPGV